jgi:hypothetical protein
LADRYNVQRRFVGEEYDYVVAKNTEVAFRGDVW